MITAIVIAAQLFLTLEAVPVGRMAEDTSGAVGDSVNLLPWSDDSDIETISLDLEGIGTENDDKIIFEGDIVTNLEQLREFYDIDEEMEKELNISNANDVHKRAATSLQDKLWPNWTVPYEITSSYSENDIQMILHAMEFISNQTCLRFFQRTTEHDYIHFRDGSGCSSAVGHRGGLQHITLARGCRRHGIILHEIGHALGLWHEQSRPDRDSYVTILWDNIKQTKRHNFRKRIDKVIDYQGTGYDYGSVMHYSRRAFRNCSNCNTITVTNETEYERQGQPRVGQRISLSPSDIIQMNRLYNCPAPGQQGLLMLYIRYGHDTQTHWPAYVKIEALTSTGNKYTQPTTSRRNPDNPTWNEVLFFKTTMWQLFRIRMWRDRSSHPDTPVGMSETVPLLDQPRTSSMRKYCMNTACSGYIMYDYKLLETVHGQLEVRLREAPSRKKISSAESGSQKPTVTVTTISPDGSSSPYTLTKSNRWVIMKGCSFADHIKIDIEGAVVQTEGSQLIHISPGLQTYCLPDVSFLCRTYAPQRLEVRLTPDRDECHLNPCLNGGTCIDGCGTYSCSCPDYVTGNRCQYK